MSETENQPDAQTSQRRFAGGHFAGGMPAEKSRNFGGTLQRLIGLIGPDRSMALLLVLAACCGVGLAVAGPKILGTATDTIVRGALDRHMNWSRLEAILGFAIAVYVGSAAFQWAQSFLIANVVQRAMQRLRDQVEDKINRLSLPYIDGQPRGELLSRVTNDIDNVGQSMQQSMSQVLTASLTIVGVMIAMLLIDWVLGVLSLLVIPASLLIVRFITRRSKSRYLDQWRITGDVNAHVEEVFTGHALVKVFGRTAATEAEFAAKNAQLYDASYRAQFLAGLIQPFMMFLGNINFVVIAVVGGLRVASGQLSIGDIQAFIQYSRNFTRPLTMMASMATVIQSGVASAERVFDLLDADEQSPDPSEPASPTTSRGRVEFADVRFSYTPDKPLIEGLSLVAEPGRTIAIVGPTGAGKTTLVNLLMRFYEIDGGRICRRRRRHLRHDPCRPALADRHGAPGHLALRRHDPREHCLRESGRERGRNHRRSPCVLRRPVRALVAGGLRHRARRRGRGRVRW